MNYIFVLCGHCLLTESEEISDVVERLVETSELLIDMDNAGVELVGEDDEGRLLLMTQDPDVARRFGMELEGGMGGGQMDFSRN